MSSTNPLNVYKGADSVKQYYDPDAQPPMPLVELPGRLNPFEKDGVRIYAKMVTALPAHNVKSLPGQLFQASNTVSYTDTKSSQHASARHFGST